MTVKSTRENDAFLRQTLAPFQKHLMHDDVSEVCYQGQGNIWIEKAGAASMVCVKDNTITEEKMVRLSHLLAGETDQTVNKQHPLLSTLLSSGERVQIVRKPTSFHGTALAIRKQVVRDLSLSDYEKSGAFDLVEVSTKPKEDSDREELQRLVKQGRVLEFLEQIVLRKKNILVSGGTSTGKTTFLNALVKAIPSDQRVVTIEDTQEVRPTQKNWLSLVASKGEQGLAKVTVRNLLEASLRLRPDRILLGELRGDEAFAFLRMTNSGHPGSITTVHADTPQGAFDQIALMTLQSGINMDRNIIMQSIRSVIDVVVQLDRIEGKRIISDIWWPDKE